MPKIPNPDSDAPIKPYAPKDTGTNIELYAKAAEFVKLKSDVDRAAKRLDELKKDLRLLVDVVSADGSGHKILVLKNGTNAIELKQTLRITTTIRPDALPLLKEHGFDKAVELVEVVRNDVLEIMVTDGEIPEELYAELFAKRENYAFTAKVTSVAKPRARPDAGE